MEAPCRRCGSNPVQAYEKPGGSVLAGVCEDCRDRELAAERERTRRAAEEKRREEIRYRKENIEGILKSVGVDISSHRRATLSGFDPEPDHRALREATRFVERFRAGDRPRLFLYSARKGEGIAPGNGKTYLACAILRALLLSGDLEPKDAAFVRETRMTITLRRLIGNGSPEAYLDSLAKRELLVLDDVGKAKSDSAWLRELLFELIAGREDYSTIVTSNYSLDHLAGRDPWYNPLVSRLMDRGAAVCLHGPDRRLAREQEPTG